MTHPNDIPLGTLVMKFGGTSVGTPQAMAQTVEIVRQSRSKWPRLVVITSALATVTNSLLESATRSAQGETQVIIQNATRLKQLHYQIVDTLVIIPEHRTQVLEEIDQRIAEFASLCRAMSILGEATPRALDTVGALGERLSVRVLAAALQEAGVDAQAVESTCLIETDQQSVVQ